MEIFFRRVLVYLPDQRQEEIMYHFKKVVENQFNCPYDWFRNSEYGGTALKIEEFKNITIAYIRRTGNYGFENKIFMENFKEYLREKELLDKSSVILGIALDNPAMTDKNKLRYDVGLIVNGNPDIALDIRKIPDGIYAVFELPHTEQDITAFWSNIQKLVGSLSVDETKPVIERYPADKVAKHLCEFCIPLKKLS